MTPEEIARVPSSMLYQHKTTQLREWLHNRGLQMTLAELEAERQRRRDVPSRRTS